MKTTFKSTRIESIDILRGIAMILMALDHSRDYFLNGTVGSPTNIETTTPILFFTRFITHYCAPVFIFLAGTSAYLYGRKKTKRQLFNFLFTRGLWLIILEIFVNSLNWSFDYTYRFIPLQVIWAIGISMVILSFLVWLPKKGILVVGALLVIGHNLLDTITMQGNSLGSILWYILHQPSGIPVGQTRFVYFAYPVIPWIGLIALGYCLGHLFTKNFSSEDRKKWLTRIGLGSILAFFLLRGINSYGDLKPWIVQNTTQKTIMSFFNVTKYPPSLAYILITIGPSLLFLYFIEGVKNKVTNIFLVFGRVPLFYYFLHIFVIHIFAIAGVVLFSNTKQGIIINMSGLAKHGYSLTIVYLVWAGIITLLYFPCKKYMTYKGNNKTKWWLSYL